MGGKARTIMFAVILRALARRIFSMFISFSFIASKRERNRTKEREKRDQKKRVIRNYVSETSFFFLIVTLNLVKPPSPAWGRLGWGATGPALVKSCVGFPHGKILNSLKISFFKKTDFLRFQDDRIIGWAKRTRAHKFH